MTVVVVSTGGTIASTAEQGSGAKPNLSGDELVSAVPQLVDFDVKMENFSMIPSPHFTVSQMVELLDVIRELHAKPTVEGVVVTQGTDVLEETAYWLDLCYDGETPVVVTGAMRNPSLAGPDGPANLFASVLTALDCEASDRGVLVTFAGRVMPAREVTKTHSQQVDTFKCPEFGPLGIVEEGGVTWRRDIENPDPTFDPDPAAVTSDIPSVVVTVDMPGDHLRRFDDAPAICVATYGAGHVPLDVVDTLEELREDDVPVIVTTRCPEGRLARSTYSFRGSERTLQELGCLFSDLNVQKTRIRTIAALAAGRLEDAFDYE